MNFTSRSNPRCVMRNFRISNPRVCEGGQNSEFPNIYHRAILGVSGFSALGIGTFFGVSEFRTRCARVRMADFSEFPSLLPLGGLHFSEFPNFAKAMQPRIYSFTARLRLIVNRVPVGRFLTN